MEPVWIVRLLHSFCPGMHTASILWAAGSGRLDDLEEASHLGYTNLMVR